MNDAPIGIFDSGVGGLTVARAIIDQLPRERLIYVGDTATQTLWAYDLAADGTASGKRLVMDVTDDSRPGRVDGVRVDSAGRVYVTCPGGICVVDPAQREVIERLMSPPIFPVPTTALRW